MGFDGRWVNLVMACVYFVSYSFLLNGRVYGDVTPSRGLTHGDLLSNYLFILVADAFSHMLKRHVQETKLHGAKASRNGPKIPLLLFADVNIFSLEITHTITELLLIFSTSLNKHPGFKLIINSQRYL